jgi:DNA-binding MarR family transcriptional regulator
MSFNLNDLNDSPSHFLVLNSIFKNFNTTNKIIKFTNLTKAETEDILKELEDQKLITGSEKKSFFFGKKIQYNITDTGLKILNEKNQELEEKIKQVQQWYTQGDQTQLQNFMGDNRAWLPLMILSGIMNMVFFSSLMSFAGLSLNPMESYIFGGGGGGTDNSAIDNSATSDAGATAGDASGFDFGGGGFDSF